MMHPSVRVAGAAAVSLGLALAPATGLAQGDPASANTVTQRLAPVPGRVPGAGTSAPGGDSRGTYNTYNPSTYQAPQRPVQPLEAVPPRIGTRLGGMSVAERRRLADDCAGGAISAADAELCGDVTR